MMRSLEPYGNIEFKPSLRAQSIRVSILAKGLKVSLPMGVSEQKALDFIESVKSAILAKQERLKQKSAHASTHLSEDRRLKTLSFEVQLKKTVRKDLHFALREGVLHIEFPEHMDSNHPQSQLHFWNGINYFLRKEAKRILPARTKELSLKHGFNYSEVKIQSSKSRWGSCSGRGNINYSFYMMLLPPHLVDYVILHELCHTREMNHSEHFWNWMDQVTEGKSKQLRKELKNYRMPE